MTINDLTIGKRFINNTNGKTVVISSQVNDYIGIKVYKNGLHIGLPETIHKNEFLKLIKLGAYMPC
jgi:hypothetical protein